MHFEYLSDELVLKIEKENIEQQLRGKKPNISIRFIAYSSINKNVTFTFSPKKQPGVLEGDTLVCTSFGFTWLKNLERGCNTTSCL